MLNIEQLVLKEYSCVSPEDVPIRKKNVCIRLHISNVLRYINDNTTGKHYEY